MPRAAFFIRWSRNTLVSLTVGVAAGACGGDDDPIQPANNDPQAVISADPLEVPEGDDHQTVVTLDGSASSDPDGDPLTYEWTAPSGDFVNGTNAGSQVAEVTFPGTAPYNVVLVVQDGRAGSASASVTIGIIAGPANEPPTAVISADPTTVPQGDNNQTVVTLDGSGSTDPEGDELSFMWTAESGTFVNGTGPTSEVAQVTFPGSAPYLVTLTVDDGNGNQDTAQTTIAVG